MQKKPEGGKNTASDCGALRSGRKLRDGDSFDRNEVNAFLHDLRVHQAELEVQNEELRRTRDELETVKEKYFDLYELAPVGYFSLGEEEKILEVNLFAANLLGVEKGKLRNRPFTNFVSPEFQDAFHFHHKKIRETGVKATCELKLLKKNGDSLFVRLESLPIRDSENVVSQIRTAVVDICERKLVEATLKEASDRNEMLLNLLPHPAMLIDKNRKILAANLLARKTGAVIGGYCSPELDRAKGARRKGVPGKAKGLGLSDAQGIFSLAKGEESQHRLVTVVEDSNDGVTILALNGDIQAWNSGAEKIYGFSASEALNMSIFDLVPSGMKNETRNWLKDIALGKVIPPFETKRVSREGRLLEILLTATKLVEGKKIYAIATTERDVTNHNLWLASIKKLPQRIILAQEKERARISQEIHSDFGQALITLKLYLSMLASSLGDADPQVKRSFDEVKNQLTSIIKKARDLSHELAPSSLKYIGLVPAMKKLVEISGYQKKVKISFFHRNMDRVSFQSKDIIIYRIVQEALNNIFKHAKATEVHINATFHKSLFSLEIRDNGKGFVSSRSKPTRGLGLDLMKEQVTLVRGVLRIESQVGKGTTIKIVVPVKEQEEK